MKIVEFFQGTKNERAQQQRAQFLQAKKNLKERERQGIQDGVDISRRLFLRKAIGSTLVLLAAASGITFIQTREEDYRLELADRLEHWRFPGGVLAANLFPEIHDYANLLAAPSLPQLRSPYPLRVYYASLPSDVPSGWFQLDQKFDRKREEDLAIAVTAQDGQKFTLPFIAETKPQIRLASSIRGTNAEMVVLAKEVSQALDFVRYCRRYRQLQEKLGNRFQLINNTGSSVDQDYIDFSIGGIQIAAELEKSAKSWLLDFMDEGGFLRIGAILYANWERHFANEREYMPRNYITAGENFTQPLIRDGVIILQDGYFKWGSGQTPDVSSDGFYSLWGTYSSRRIKS